VDGGGGDGVKAGDKEERGELEGVLGEGWRSAREGGLHFRVWDWVRVAVTCHLTANEA